MRLDRHRLDHAKFPFECTIDTRYGDVDSQGHVNNVAVANILQECRSRFAAANGLSRDPDCQFVVASLMIEYARDVLYPDSTQVYIGVLEINNRSYRLGQVLRQRGIPCVYAETSLVSRRGAGAVALPETTRARLYSLTIKQPQMTTP
jgi:acyl-CoA thioester hydrolase